MKNKAIILILFWMATSHIFASSIFTTTYTSDDGSRLIHSPFQLKAEDFKDSDFFLKDIRNSYYTDLNVQIFNLIKSKAKDYVIDPDFNFKKRFKKGELILVPKDIISEGVFLYAKYDNKEKEFRIYYFLFEMSEDDYKTYGDNIQYYEKCIKGIDYCNWVLKNCSNPTIQKERIVEVPLPAEKTYVYESGRSGETGQGHYEYTPRYTTKVEYYTVANPNYDLNKVANAKKNLPLWEKDKAATQEKLKYLPFRIYQDISLFQ